MRAMELALGQRRRRRATRLAGALGVLWRFSRPHTLIGTTVGVAGLYVVAVAELGGSALANLWWVLLAGWCVNVFIVGINQLEDVELDRINKPELPLAAGELSPEAGRRIVAVAAVIPVALALTQGAIELLGVLLSLAIGAAYSVPPLRLKRFPIVAALSIAFVRSTVLNLVVWLHFSHALGGGNDITPAAWALTAVTLPFSLAIAVLKDMPDVEGDRRFGIATFSVRLGPAAVLRTGVAALTIAGLGMAAAGATVLDGANAPLLVGAHLAGVALLWWRAAHVDTSDAGALTAFYGLVWRLFFGVYVVVPLAYVIG